MKLTTNRTKNEKEVTSSPKGFSQNTFYVVAGLAMVLAIAPMGLAVAFGQQEYTELPDRKEGMINARVEKLTEIMELLGATEFEYVPEVHKLTVSGYHGEFEVQEDLAGVLTDFYGFSMVDYGATQAGIYFVAVWYEDIGVMA